MARLTSYSADISIHDNGELRFKLAGCRGAEYYSNVDFLILRLQQFLDLELGLSIILLFTRNDRKDGFYMPEQSSIESWNLALRGLELRSLRCEVANKETSNGKLSVPEFYFERNSNLIGFRPVAAHQIETIVPYELSRGFDIKVNSSLYKADAD